MSIREQNVFAIKKIPTDLAVVVLLVLLTCVFVLVPVLSDTPIRTVLGLPMVLFLPGYALIAALFPNRDDLDGIERVALSFGLSIAVVPLIGLGLNYTQWGIRLVPILVSLSVFTLGMCAVAVIRRAELGENAFNVSFGAAFDSAKEELVTAPKGRLDRALTILLVLSILASVVTLVYVVVTPKEGEKFTEFYILGPGGMADDYPTTYLNGDSGTVIVGVVNHEYAPINYTLDIRLNNNSLHIDDGMRNLRLAHNETWEHNVIFTPTSVGDDMKLQFLLFREENQTHPYRDLHLWINVSEGAGGS